MTSLFGDTREPLAARLRPRTLEEFVGQDHIIGHGRLLRRAIQMDRLGSLIFAGPPGTGKTTLAHLIAQTTSSEFTSLNAVLSGVKELRDAIADARSMRDRANRKTLLFVDEVHRWNKSQQDALLPWVENGTVVLIGATTENPFFEVNDALLSRSRVFTLLPLTDPEMRRILNYALANSEQGYGNYDIRLDDDAVDHLVRSAGGDARTLLNALELAVEAGPTPFPPTAGSTIAITLADAEESIQQRAVLYDKDGDYHFDTISAFIKSIRGSDTDAALYWLARMVEAGESPRFIFRRLLILAAEDIGLADPAAITVVEACAGAFERLGLPEGQYHLAEATLYLALAPKSNSANAYFAALEEIRKTHADVPLHLRDASRDGPARGDGVSYKYPHSYSNHWVAQQYLPASLHGRFFYRPGELGWEAQYVDDVAERRESIVEARLDALEENMVIAGTREVGWFRLDTSDRRSEIYEKILEVAAFERDDRTFVMGTGLFALIRRILSSSINGTVTVLPYDQGERDLISGTLHETIAAGMLTIAETITAFSEREAFETAIYRIPFPLLSGGENTLMEDIIRFFESVVLRTLRRWILVVPDLRGSTRLSDLITETHQSMETLKSVEEGALTDTGTVVESVLSRTGYFKGDSQEVEETFTRRIEESMISRWLSETSTLGSRLSEDDRTVIQQELRERVSGTRVTWTRRYRLYYGNHSS